METAIRWSPNSTLSEQRFLLADLKAHSFKTCRVEKYDDEIFRHRILSTYLKAPEFRAFDWAPFDESLVAIGQWSGETNILRIDEFCGKGDDSVRKTSARPISLPAKHQRLCNAVAFSKHGMLATGLERVRNDFCLNIWDVNQRLMATSSSGTGSGRGFVEPNRKYASSEAISSIKWFAAQPEVVIAGVKGIGIRIYDLREHTGNPSLQFQTSSVHNIAIDHMDENHFACAGPPKDTTIQIWDVRLGSPYSAADPIANNDPSNQASPVLQYTDSFRSATNADQTSVWSLKYCKGKSGFLGALASDGNLKVFETNQAYAPVEGKPNFHEEQSSDFVGSSFESIYTKHVHHIERAFDHVDHGRKVNERIVSFDLTNLAGAQGTPCAIVLRGDQSVGIQELNGPPPALAVSPLGTIVLSKVQRSTTLPSQNVPSKDRFLDNTIRFFNPFKERTIGDDLRVLRGREITAPKDQQEKGTGTDNFDARDDNCQSGHGAHERFLDVHRSSHRSNIEEDLIAYTVHRRRCAEGYLFDCDKNIEILHDDSHLQSMWKWTARAKNIAEDEDTVTGNLDLSYLGIYNLWTQEIGHQRSSRNTKNHEKHEVVTTAISAMSEKLSLPAFTTIETAFPEHRQLCLYTCGLGIPYEQLEDTVKQMVQRGEQSKAAVLAMIHDQAKLAFLALRNGNRTSIHRQLSLALAGHVKGITDETWDSTIRDLAKDTTDPYALAILALVGSGSWHEVLSLPILPLLDRVGIALMYLPDSELTKYIATTTTSVIKNGDISGVVLTGLSEKALSLFENHIRKNFDLQTAVLALSFTCPRYFSDHRVTVWRETYRSYLNTWRMYINRVHFDMQSTILSRPSPIAAPTLPPPPRQITLRCTHCENPLDQNDAHLPNHRTNVEPSTGITTTTTTHQGSIFGGPKDGTICPKCGRHMPRCVLCMKWLGMPNPHTKGAMARPLGNREAMEGFVSVCRSCWHASCGGHAEEWFAGHRECPVPGCGCKCAEIDGRRG